jgi:nicotinamide-nucleotide amidase
VFYGGFVCYSKACKNAILGVPSSLINETTAVSEPVAKALARGALDRTSCDLALSITGVAGPEPDEDGNPVGLVHIAIATKDSGTGHLACELLGKTPADICTEAITHALTLALEIVPPFRHARERGVKVR